MNKRYCPYCNSTTIIKYGKCADKIRYRCKCCNRTWTNKKRGSRLDERIWEDYIMGVTISKLAKQYGKSEKTIRNILKNIPMPNIIPSKAKVIMMDVTYFTRELGVLVVINAISGRTIYAKVINHAERVSDYEEALLTLHKYGVYPKVSVVNGRKGVRTMLEEYGIKVQICQFHMIAFINACITRNPVLEPNIELHNIALSLTHVDKQVFSNMVYGFKLRNEIWLKERTFSKDPDTNKLHWEYTHRLSRRAINSLIYNLPYLFTYQEYKELQVPNTTNLLEGRFGYIKRKILNHNGINMQLKIKIFFSFLSRA